MTMVSCLLIEHDDAQRRQLAEMLATLGMECTGVARADEGLAACRALRPDVVIMEANAPQNLRPFLRLTNAGGPRQRPVILFYSKTADMSVIGETILSGAAEFLMLPFDRDLLRFKLRQAGVLPAKAA
jgi:DNA-binding response OmpR family regulator